MGPVRILILVVALAAAVGAVVVVRGMSKAQAPVVAAAPAPAPPPAMPKTMVLVAKRDLPVGTKLEAADMTWQAWPQESLNPAFIVQTTAPKPSDQVGKVQLAAVDTAKTIVGEPDAALTNLVGSVVREPMLATEPVVERKLVKAGGAGIMAVTLEPGMRAVATPLSAESAAGGFILPGDHVDVVQSRQIEAGPANGATAGASVKHFATSTVLKNVKVLAIDQNTGVTKGSSVVGATATLELTPSQSEVLVLAKAQGELTLVLRSYADASGGPVTVADIGPSGGALKPQVVKVFKNNQMSEVAVTR